MSWPPGRGRRSVSSPLTRPSSGLKGSAGAIKTDRSVFRLSAPSHAAETVAEPLLDINTDPRALETSGSPVDETILPFKLWSIVGQSLDPSATSVFPSVPSGRHHRGFRSD